MSILSPVCPDVSLGASALASASLPVTSATNFKLENNRAARLGVGALYVTHSAANSAVALGGKISASIKRARSQHDDADHPRRLGAADEYEDSKCASIKRKHGVASHILLDSGSLRKKKTKKKKSTNTASEPLDPVVLRPSQLLHEVVPQNTCNTHGKRKLPCSAEAALLIAGDHSQLSQNIVRAVTEGNSVCDANGRALPVDEDLGSGLRNYQQVMRKRTKTRSKAKNVKKDKRPPELRPGGERYALVSHALKVNDSFFITHRYAGSSGTWRPPPTLI